MGSVPLAKLLDAPKLFSLLKQGTPRVRVLDCTFSPGPKPDWQQFLRENYGKFDQLIQRPSNHKNAYLSAHIPGALFFDLDVAFYPGEFERFAQYPPKEFEKYAHLLGLNTDDSLVFYGRGPSLAGWTSAARTYWLFKSYGHERVHLLDGGLDNWQRHGLPVETSEIFEIPAQLGNWSAKGDFSKLITFEELTSPDPTCSGRDLLGKCQNGGVINLLDSRQRQQFQGIVETGLHPAQSPGTHLPGAVNIPSIELLKAEDGTLKRAEELRDFIQSSGFDASRPETVTMCNLGMQASLLAFVLDNLGIKTRLYSGSLTEMKQRAPERISAQPADRK